MARNRMIKPEFWSSGKVARCSHTARLLFIGMWNFADDYGNIAADARDLKMKVFPGDDLTADDTRRALGELVREKLIHPYDVDNKDYFAIHDWTDHQKIDRPSRGNRNPPPPSLVEGSSRARDERKGKEGKDQPSSPCTPSYHQQDVELLPRAPAEKTQPDEPIGPRELPKLTADWPAASLAVKAVLKARWPDWELKIDMLDTGLVRQWLADGCDLQLDILTPIDVVCGERLQAGTEAGPPNTLKYFHKRVMEHQRERTNKPAPTALPEGMVEYAGMQWAMTDLRELWRMRLSWLKDRPWMAAWKDAPQPHTRNSQPPPGLPVDIWAQALEAHWRFVDIQAGRRRA